MNKKTYFPPIAEELELQSEQAVFNVSAEEFTEENYWELMGE